MELLIGRLTAAQTAVAELRDLLDARDHQAWCHARETLTLRVCTCGLDHCRELAETAVRLLK